MEREMAKNKKLAKDLKLKDKNLEVAEETKKKGSSSKIELNKLINWNSSKKEIIEELEAQI